MKKSHVRIEVTQHFGIRSVALLPPVRLWKRLRKRPCWGAGRSQLIQVFKKYVGRARWSLYLPFSKVRLWHWLFKQWKTQFNGHMVIQCRQSKCSCVILRIVWFIWCMNSIIQALKPPPHPPPPITVRVPECFPLRKLGSWIRLVHSFLLQMYSILFFHM